MTKPIVIQDQVWLAARSIVGPGVTVGSGAMLSLGSIATRDLLAWQIHQGSPAIPVKPRNQSRTSEPIERCREQT
jgi:putative colanic acid biosynthesis acetyltransferase WcaF